MRVRVLLTAMATGVAGTEEVVFAGKQIRILLAPCAAYDEYSHFKRKQNVFSKNRIVFY